MYHMNNAANALRTAMRYAKKLDEESTVCSSLYLDNGIYEISLRTPYQHYEFYIDSADYDVKGINTEPSLEPEFYSESSEFMSPLAA